MATIYVCWQRALEEATRTIQDRDEENKRLNGVIEDQKATIEGQLQKERQHETDRRILHNMIQELKARYTSLRFISSIFCF